MIVIWLEPTCAEKVNKPGEILQVAETGFPDWIIIKSESRPLHRKDKVAVLWILDKFSFILIGIAAPPDAPMVFLI
ncbi:MAG: hypothetical protein IPO85_00210 [Saprospiraceae bacterium]|uniref:Uncharacterized protein n=1 Tax=Candidatus Defluviibacterium haderslevense TaxID=2981993 RepID=A0A9D7S6A0_9BACT|nr:hypothetical protein [Candidatus Defluviibacterium haderslevense]